MVHLELCVGKVEPNPGGVARQSHVERSHRCSIADIRAKYTPPALLIFPGAPGRGWLAGAGLSDLLFETARPKSHAILE